MSAVGGSVGPFSVELGYADDSKFVKKRDHLLSLRELDTEVAETLYTQLLAVRECLKTVESITVETGVVKYESMVYPLSVSLIVTRPCANLSSLNIQDYLNMGNVSSSNLSVLEDEYERNIVYIRGNFEQPPS